MMCKLPLVLLSLLVLLFGCKKTQHFNKDKLDSLFDALNSHDQNMGSIAISDNGTVVYQKVIGYSQINGDMKTPANIKTKYRIGSITKMFTAVMVFQLIEEGKLTLNTALAKYYPQLPNASKITIREMLSHRSGLYNFTKDSLYIKYKGKPKTEKEMLDIFEKQKPEFEPDLNFDYSNTNFVLLGYIIEKITGKSYAEELKKRITAKIGLRDTYYGTDANPLKNEAYSYNYISKWCQMPETNLTIPGGAGAIVSTPTDLVKFIDALFADKLISHENLENMKTIKDYYGMAMFIFPFYDENGYGHYGGMDGFLSTLFYFPKDKLSIAYVSNGVRYATNDILTGSLSIYYNKPFIVPKFKSITLTSTDLNKYLGNYTSDQLPWKVVITKNGVTLMAQISDQGTYALDAQGSDNFGLNLLGVTLQFNTANHSFTVTQGGKTYTYFKVN
jgi:D-alanyl-D-alanine carboxypeptidase